MSNKTWRVTINTANDLFSSKVQYDGENINCSKASILIDANDEQSPCLKLTIPIIDNNVEIITDTTPATDIENIEVNK